MPLTLKELTLRLASASGESTDTLNRQLRSWTESAALPLAGDLFIGTGKKRLYEDVAVLLAAVAIELARWDIPIGKIRLILSLMYSQLTSPRDSILKEIKCGKNDSLVVVFPSSDENAVDLAFIGPNKFGDLNLNRDTNPSLSFLVLDLPELWKKLQ